MCDKNILKESELLQVTSITQTKTKTHADFKINILFVARLRSLASNPSRESIQTLARWQLFHRRNHGRSLCSTLCDEIKSNATSFPKKINYLDIAHEMLIFNHNSINNKGSVLWEHCADIRSVLGEVVVRPALNCLRSELFLALNSGSMSLEEAGVVVTRLKTQSSIWVEFDCFDSPTLLDEAESIINLIRMDFERYHEDKFILNEAVRKNNKLLGSAGYPVKESSANIKQENNQENTGISSLKTSDLKGDKNFLNFDYENDISKNMVLKMSQISKDLAERKVKTNHELNPSLVNCSDTLGCDVSNSHQKKDENSHRENSSNCILISQLHDLCRSIAFTQINRDLKVDSILYYSMILSLVPDDVLASCRAAFNTQRMKLNTDNNKFFSSEIIDSIPDDVLDLDISNAITNLKNYDDIVSKQSALRKKSIGILLNTNSKFGSEEAAQHFYYLLSREKNLQVRKEKIRDAMELEGLDFEGLDSEESSSVEDTSSEFLWFPKNGEFSCLKRPRL